MFWDEPEAEPAECTGPCCVEATAEERAAWAAAYEAELAVVTPF